MATRDEDFPQLFIAADRTSLAGQRLYVGLTRTRLLCVVAAAACGIATLRVGAGRTDLLGLAAVVLFVTALVLETVLWKRRPEREWYDGRAVAESAKTLAWKYAVGGDPFPVGMPITEARRIFVGLLDEIRVPYRDLELLPVLGESVTPWMDGMRSQSLKNRADTYIADRIKDQQAWYQSKSRQNRMSANRWRTALVALEIGGAALALLEAFTQTSLSFTPAVSAAIGAIVAWVATKQHDQLSRAYATTVADLASAIVKLECADSDDTWAREMNDAEDAISREHTLWLASRSFAR